MKATELVLTIIIIDRFVQLRTPMWKKIVFCQYNSLAFRNAVVGSTNYT